jgi:hypothetical protein
MMLTGNVGQHGAGVFTWAGNYKGALFQASPWSGPGVASYIFEDPFKPVLDENARITRENIRNTTEGEEVAYWGYGDKPLIVNTPLRRPEDVYRQKPSAEPDQGGLVQHARPRRQHQRGISHRPVDASHEGEEVKEPESDDPMELRCEVLPGETAFLTRCVIEEFAQLGYGAGELAMLFRDPIYPMLNGILKDKGEPFVLDMIQEVLGECGSLKTTTTVVHTACEGDD